MIVQLIPNHMQSGNAFQIGSCLGNVCSAAHLGTKMAAFPSVYREVYEAGAVKKESTLCYSCAY